MKRIRVLILVSAFGIMITGADLSFVNLRWLIIFWLALIFMLMGLRIVKAEPPHKAIVTFLGKRTDESKNEGLTWIIPLLEGLIHVNVEKKNQDLGILSIRTPDMALLNVPVSLTWTPNQNNLIEYLDSGGEEGVKNILRDITIERIRNWAMHPVEGPQNYLQAFASKEEAINTIIKSVAGKELEKIPSSIPTSILFDYFNEPQIPPRDDTRKSIGGENWMKMRKEFIERREDEEKVKKAIEKRKLTIKEIQGGNGKQIVKHLGIILNRLNIGDMDIKPDTDLYKAVQTKIKEESERAGEIAELEHVATRIKKLMDPPLEFSLEQALEIVQTERKKVGKNIYEIKGLKDTNIGKVMNKIIGGAK
ncbi:hypothetical protein KKH07_01250 [Patescibacteria group bacterium]|nr:hypothetical protein [Patescibacteria group bacterium]MBU1563705.1 hypothetical protein [Patescibacteria group bacterium]MBU2067972.1 hypothetical protein [Patescibacteria group bacterium]